MWRLWTTDASLRCVSSAMSSALSNFAGFTLSTLSALTSLCYVSVSYSFFRPYLLLHTLPSSHCTSICPCSSSSTIQPLMNAFCGSFSHTYLFPEKSFSPSIPFTSSGLDSDSSALINLGAKVPDPVAGTFFEFDRVRVDPTLPGDNIPLRFDKD